jgi:hypothetical protein
MTRRPVQLGPEQRKAMIEGMVNRLSERLHRDGADVDRMAAARSLLHGAGRNPTRRAPPLSTLGVRSPGDAIQLQRLDDLWKAVGQRTAR